ncbi:MAG: thiamine diphosphokinase [Cyclonatronaceae bacterium]
MICCNGQPPAASLLHQAAGWADYIIAADGGANVLLSHAVVPDAITGDMDSYSRDAFERFLKLRKQEKSPFPPEKTPELIPNPDQESNDLEKALELARKRQESHHPAPKAAVVICGATGYRLDHSLKNLSVMQQFLPHFSSLFMIDDYLCTFLHPPRKTLRFHLPEATPVSLFPLSGRVEGLTTRGLKYELDDDFLENGRRDGSSNEIAAGGEISGGFEEKAPDIPEKTLELRYQRGQLAIMISPLNGMKWPLLS